MVPHVILGATYGFAAAVQPGPFQTYLVSSTLTTGCVGRFRRCLSPLLSDMPIVSLVLLVLTQVPPLALNVLRLAGGLFLLYLAAGAFVAFRTYRAPQVHQPSKATQTLFKAAIVNLLNPNPYISWSLILGPLLLEAWRAAPAYGIGLLVSFYATMMATTALILVPFAGARALGPTIGRAALGVSAAALAAFGVYQIWAEAPRCCRDCRS